MKKTKQIYIGNIPVGGGAPVSVQSMTNTCTGDADATLAQIRALAAAGCDIIRCAVPDEAAAQAMKRICAESPLPVVADIHFDYKLALASVEAGAKKIRINPGNIGSADRIRAVADACRERNIPIRVGVNTGSIEKDILEKFGRCPEALVESALRNVHILEDANFDNICISLKSSNVTETVEAYSLLSERTDYPLHVGVTEAGTAYNGLVRSAVGIGTLLMRGIGDTIRVSLSAPPVEEVKVGNQILQSLNLRPRKLEIVSCPSCGRAQVDVYTLAEQVTAGLEGMEVPLRVAVMGCVVNGPGEAREADLGVASGNGKAQIFVKGEVIKTVPEDQIVETLIEEAMKIAESMGESDGEDAGTGGPMVVVG